MARDADERKLGCHVQMQKGGTGVIIPTLVNQCAKEVKRSDGGNCSLVSCFESWRKGSAGYDPWRQTQTTHQRHVMEKSSEGPAHGLVFWTHWATYLEVSYPQ